MSGFNGSGTFNISGVGLPYVSGNVISSSVANQLNTDLATGLSKCILNDGQQTIYANIGWSNFNINNLSAIGIGTASPSGQLQIVNGATTNLIVTSAGNVGIGTSSPSEKLHVYGGNFVVNSTQAIGWGDRTAQIVGVTGSSGYIRLDTNNAERMRIDSSGNVGIGTSSPAQLLTLTKNTATNTFLLINNTAGTTYVGTNADGTSELSASGASGVWLFKTADVERMRIDSSGNVGIGTSSPTTKFDVAGASVKFYNPALTTNGDATTTMYFDKPSVGWSNAKFAANAFTFNIQNTTDILTINSSGTVSLSASPSAGDNSTKVATTAFVQQTVGGSKLQPLTATGSGTITITLGATTLDFRSTTAGGGTPSTVTLSSSTNIQVIGAATLGFTNGTAGRIAVLAINNAGTIELAVCNANGGFNLDENSLITTSAVSGGTGANTIYSTTARTSVAYRVVGYIDATNTSSSWSITYTSAGARFPIAQAPLRMARAWVNFDGSAGPITPRASYNISSVTRNTTGTYTLNFAVAMADSNYIGAYCARNTTVSNVYYGGAVLETGTRSTTSVQILYTQGAATSGYGGATDNPTIVTAVIFGN